MYLTYDEYQNMGGTIDSTAYPDLEFEAEALVNWHTFSRFKKDSTFPNELKMCMKYLIDKAYAKQQVLDVSGSGDGSSGAIASQSNDGVSISYNLLSAKDLMDAIKDESAKSIHYYLQDVVNEAGRRVLYRGIYPDE